MDKKPKRRRTPDMTINDLCAPLAVYELTLEGIKRPTGTSEAEIWQDLRDVGRRLGLPALANESLRDYAGRLQARLAQFDGHAMIDGAAVYALRHAVELLDDTVVRRLGPSQFPRAARGRSRKPTATQSKSERGETQ